jgi:hypothetical protein
METDCTRDDVPARSAPTPSAAGTRLLHIGPHKTGTTSIQGALFGAKEAMGDAKPTERHWETLVEQVAATGRRTSVISSEFFADAPGDETIERIVRELGGDRVHVVVTLRPLVRIMPSQWQQYVQNGLRMGYEDWLRHMLRKPPYEKPTPSFWRRHRHDRLVERWVRAAGADRVTVVVVDDRDRGGLMRTFEALLGLPENLLHEVPDTANRSLTLAETEMLRNLNVEFRGNELPDELYSQLVRYGAVLHMKNACAPGPGDVKIRTPQWAAEAAAETGAEMALRIGATGVRVLGDPGILSAVPEPPTHTDAEPRMSPEVAAQALYGALAAAAGAPLLNGVPGQARTVHRTPSKELVRVLGHRALKRLRRR